MPSAMGGGSIGGSGGGSSSGGGGGSSYGHGSRGGGKNHYLPKFSAKHPFKGAKKYYYYDKRGKKHSFFYSGKLKTKRITHFVWVITLMIVFGLGMLALSLYMSIPHKLNGRYCEYYPEYVYDESELFTQEEKDALTNTLENFYRETGIQPYVYAVSYSDIPIFYKPLTMETLNDYSYSLYKQYFEDEGHFLILYTINTTDEVEEGNPREQMWIAMAGYDAQKVFKGEDFAKFENSLNEKLEMDICSPLKSIGDSFTESIDSIINLETMDIVLIVIASIFIPLLVGVPLAFIISSMNQRIKINSYCDYRDKNDGRDFIERIGRTEQTTLQKGQKQNKR